MFKYEIINRQQTESEEDSFTLERYRQFISFFPKQAVKILDIGCNTGRGGVELFRLNKNFQITGIDILEERLNKLPNGIYSKTILGSSSEIPIEDESFDVVVAGEFIEHLYFQDYLKTMAEVFRVLKIGGRFLLTTPNPNGLKKRFQRRSVLGGSHVSQHFPKSVKSQMKMVGFSGIKIYGSGKASRYLGYRFPFLSLYVSYLAEGNKW